MNKSRWNFVACGVNGLASLIFALTHNGLFLAITAFLVWFNWYLGNEKRKLEDAKLLAEHEASKGNDND